jgi:hypothetical protein
MKCRHYRVFHETAESFGGGGGLAQFLQLAHVLIFNDDISVGILLCFLYDTFSNYSVLQALYQTFFITHGFIFL